MLTDAHITFFLLAQHTCVSQPKSKNSLKLYRIHIKSNLVDVPGIAHLQYLDCFQCQYTRSILDWQCRRRPFWVDSIEGPFRLTVYETISFWTCYILIPLLFLANEIHILQEGWIYHVYVWRHEFESFIDLYTWNMQSMTSFQVVYYMILSCITDG